MTPHESVLGGRYQLDQVIGRGGMAEVWRARDIRLGRDVAVKRLRVDLATDPTFQARFRREAQSAAGLNHPNIVATYDTGEEADEKTGIQVPYIVMELVEGHTLRDLLRTDRRILPRKALEWTMGVLDALNYSHRAGIIHRDIKPANVMVTPSGAVKVMDFGIARAVADTSATMTQTAAVIGTAQYLSPEQARGETVDSRSDIYSAGCLLYELLTGRPPFVGESPVSVAYQHVREEPLAPSALDAEVTPAMDAVVLTSLAKDRAQRYQTSKQMRDDIARLLAGQPVVATIPAAAAAGAPTAMTQVVGQAAPGTVAGAATGAAAASTADDAEFTEEVVEEPKRRSPLLWVLAALGLALVLIIGFSAFKFFSPVADDNLVAVPSVRGQNEVAATSSLEGAGFQVRSTHVRADAKTAGQVIDQDPTGGQEAARGTTVAITVNDGPQTNKVPDLTGKTRDEAMAALVAAGFQRDQVETTDATADQESTHLELRRGQVVSSNPAAGADVVPATQKVTLHLATGRSTVPNVRGKSAGDARDRLTSLGFQKVEVREVSVDDKAQNGLVTDQKPTDGQTIDRTSTITLTVGKYTAPTSVPVPNVTGKSADEATKVLQDAGFTVARTSSEVVNPEEDGMVVDQSPRGEAAPGSTVTIGVGSYVAPSPTATASATPTVEQPPSGTTSQAPSTPAPSSTAPTSVAPSPTPSSTPS